jgi:hypothetical protein
VPDWIISPRSGVAFLDLRQERIDAGDRKRIVEGLLPYYARKQIQSVVVAVAATPTTAVRGLVSALKLQAQDRGVAFEEQRS